MLEFKKRGIKELVDYYEKNYKNETRFILIGNKDRFPEIQDKLRKKFAEFYKNYPLLSEFSFKTSLELPNLKFYQEFESKLNPNIYSVLKKTSPYIYLLQLYIKSGKTDNLISTSKLFSDLVTQTIVIENVTPQKLKYINLKKEEGF